MKSNILIYTQDTFLFDNIISDEFDVSVATSQVELFKLLNENFFQLIIMSDKYIFGGALYGYTDLVEHPIFYDMPVVAYTKNNSVDLSIKLYSLNVKGIIDSEISKDDLFSTINKVLSRSNPYIGRLRDRFIKVFIKYEDSSDLISGVLYLTNYLIWHYKIDKETAADIRMSVVFLTIGLNKNKLYKIIHLVQDMAISPYLENMMSNYQTPKSIDENIVLASILLGDTSNKNNIDMTLLDEDFFSVANEAMQKSKIYISCSHDIDNFWEKLSQIFMNNTSKLPIEYCDIYLHHIFKILYKTLVGHGLVEAEFDTLDETYFKIIIKPSEYTDDDIQRCISQCHIDNKNITLESFNHNAKPSLLLKFIKEPEFYKNTLEAKRVVDKSKMNSMHYADEAKISAVEFLNDFEVDSELLDDLIDNEREAKNFLYFDENLTQNMIEAIIVSLTRYNQLLNQTIEFEDLAYSIGALTSVISDMVLASLDEETQKTLKLYIIGIIDDLSSWREHIFVMADTQDIHYLDASLLDNCLEIEKLINPGTDSSTDDDEDDDDLEFF